MFSKTKEGKMKSSIIYCIIFLCSTPSLAYEVPSQAQSASQASAIIKELHPSEKGASEKGFSASGFFINDSKTFVTNFHAVQYALTAKKSDPLYFTRSLKIIHRGKTYSVKRVKNLSVLYDLAVLEVDGYEGEFLKLSDKTPSGRVYAMGFPKGQRGRKKQRRLVRIIPSDVFYYPNQDILYSLSPHYTFYKAFNNLKGMSGGPVVNTDGGLVGIIQKSGGGYIGVIKTLFLKNLLEKDLSLTSNAIPFIQDQVRSIFDASEKGDPVIQQRLANLLNNELFTINMLKKVKDLENKYDLKKFQGEEAELYLGKAAKQDHPEAMFRLGSVFGNARMPESSFKWMKKAAEAHHPYAQYMLYDAYKKGRGTLKSVDRAHYWLKKAAHQNHPKAMFDLAADYAENGQEENAFLWLEKSAEKGGVLAQFALALIYLTGSGRSQDVKEAMEYLHSAASADFDPAQFLLGTLYKTGAWGKINKNEKLGNHWIHKSMRLAACDSLPDIEPNMDPQCLFVGLVNSEQIREPQSPLEQIQWVEFLLNISISM